MKMESNGMMPDLRTTGRRDWEINIKSILFSPRCEYTYILEALAKPHSGAQERSKRTRGDSTYVAGH
jgi:hypothetical protein